MPEEPAFIAKLRSWWRDRTRAGISEPAAGEASAGPRALSQLLPGQVATVVGIDRADVGRARKLLALGVLPGTTIEMEQIVPTCVFRIGRSQFAVDRELAQAVRIRLAAAPPA